MSPAARWVALVVGLLTGLTIGLAYTWLLYPVELVDTHPALMREDYRRDWVRLAALSYVVDEDLEHAQYRLEGFESEDIATSVQELIEEYAAAGRPAETLRRLTTIARALGVYTPAMLVYQQAPTGTHLSSATPTPSSTLSPTPSLLPTSKPMGTSRPIATLIPSATPTPVGSPLPTDTPSPSPSRSPTSTPTAGPPFQLSKQELVCDPGQPPHIEVVIEDERGDGVPGVEVRLLWSGGADRAVSGLKPARGLGYVDFSAVEGVDYAVTVGGSDVPLIVGLRLMQCRADEGQEYVPGAWRIVVMHRAVEAD